MSLHVATGAAGGALTRSRPAAIGLGLLLHALGDRMPHEDIDSQRFELRSGVACMLALIARYGLLHPVTLGALASSCPDVEHIVRLPQPGGRKLFPTHRVEGWHRAGGVPAGAQLAAAGLILAFLLRPGR